MAILEIYTFPDPILRKQTKAVTVFAVIQFIMAGIVWMTKI